MYVFNERVLPVKSHYIVLIFKIVWRLVQKKRKVLIYLNIIILHLRQSADVISYLICKIQFKNNNKNIVSKVKYVLCSYLLTVLYFLCDEKYLKFVKCYFSTWSNLRSGLKLLEHDLIPKHLTLQSSTAIY